MAESEKTHRVVIVSAGFAGFNAARELVQLVGATTEVVVINSTDYFLYLPLMPQVAGGMVEPRHICVSLPRRLRKARFVLGTVEHVDSRQKVVSWSGPEGASGIAGSRAVGRHCASGLVQVCCALASASRAFRNRRSGPVPARVAASS
jgi:NADPH-dependent 2,4-dienoyl-CoA reductase/sulfur reductase-like enzyme